MVEYTLDTYKFETIQEEALEEFKRKLFCANTAGNLGEFLEKCELDSTLTSYQYITEDEQEKYSLKPQYVLIAGDNVFHQKEEIYKRFEKYGISRDEVNLDYIGYKKFKNKHSIEELFAYKQDKYKVILIGETPHKAKGIDDFSSLVTCMESNRLKYPKVERLEANLKLKYTHEALERKLKSIVEEEQNRQPTDITEENTKYNTNEIDSITSLTGFRQASPKDFIDKYMEFNSKNKKTI